MPSSCPGIREGSIGEGDVQMGVGAGVPSDDSCQRRWTRGGSLRRGYLKRWMREVLGTKDGRLGERLKLRVPLHRPVDCRVRSLFVPHLCLLTPSSRGASTGHTTLHSCGREHPLPLPVFRATISAIMRRWLWRQGMVEPPSSQAQLIGAYILQGNFNLGWIRQATHDRGGKQTILLCW